MSDSYVAKKYCAISNVTDCTINCPNCHQVMKQTDTGNWICVNKTKKCKLSGIPYRELKSLSTIERVDPLEGKRKFG